MACKTQCEAWATLVKHKVPPQILTDRPVVCLFTAVLRLQTYILEEPLNSHDCLTRTQTNNNTMHERIHSFILDISVAPLQVHYYPEALPTTALILCQT